VTTLVSERGGRASPPHSPGRGVIRHRPVIELAAAVGFSPPPFFFPGSNQPPTGAEGRPSKCR